MLRKGLKSTLCRTPVEYRIYRDQVDYLFTVYRRAYSVACCQLPSVTSMDKQVKNGNHIELSIMSSKGVVPMLCNINL